MELSLEELQLINEALVNEEYYRRQVVALKRKAQYDSVAISRMLQRVNVLSLENNECTSILSSCESSIRDQELFISDLNTSYSRLQRKKKLSNFSIPIALVIGIATGVLVSR